VRYASCRSGKWFRDTEHIFLSHDWYFGISIMETGVMDEIRRQDTYSCQSGSDRVVIMRHLAENQLLGKWQAVAFEQDLKAAKCTRCRLFGQMTRSAFQEQSLGSWENSGRDGNFTPALVRRERSVWKV
jgi:hypothetical protein